MSKRLVLILFTFILIMSFWNSGRVDASWAYRFVVWDDYVYIVGDETISEVDDKIGQVTLYSDAEGTYYGNFSNAYEKGTKYFAIKDVSTEVAIAVQEKDGSFVKAVRDGKYDGASRSYTTLIVGTMVFLGFVLVIVYFIQRKLQWERNG